MLVVNPDMHKGTGKGKEKSVDFEMDGDRAEEDEEWGIGEDDRSDTESEPEEVDEEEEAMNGPKKVLVKVMEEEGEKHRTHEPLVSVLQKYDSVRFILLSLAGDDPFTDYAAPASQHHRTHHDLYIRDARPPLAICTRTIHA